MSRNNRGNNRRRERFGELPASGGADVRMEGRREPGPRRADPLVAKTGAQADYISHLRGKKLTLGMGDAGTGKTYCAVAVACEMLLDRVIEKIICTRPAVEAEEDLGFLPGEIGDKFSPYFAPLRETFIARLGSGYLEWCIKREVIVAAPLAYMRGWTFDRSFVILDEAQNTTPGQMKLLLTRLGKGTFCSVNGDETQSDISDKNGLLDAYHKMSGHPDVGVTRFTVDDVVRSGFVGDVLRRYTK